MKDMMYSVLYFPKKGEVWKSWSGVYALVLHANVRGIHVVFKDGSGCTESYEDFMNTYSNTGKTISFAEPLRELRKIEMG